MRGKVLAAKQKHRYSKNKTKIGVIERDYEKRVRPSIGTRKEGFGKERALRKRVG